MYEFQFTAEEMAEISMRRAAEICEAKLNYILKDMELDIRLRADRGETTLCLDTTQYIIGFECRQIGDRLEEYCRNDYAHLFVARGYRIKEEAGYRHLTWEPKPERMDD